MAGRVGVLPASWPARMSGSRCRLQCCAWHCKRPPSLACSPAIAPGCRRSRSRSRSRSYSGHGRGRSVSRSPSRGRSASRGRSGERSPYSPRGAGGAGRGRGGGPYGAYGAGGRGPYPGGRVSERACWGCGLCARLRTGAGRCAAAGELHAHKQRSKACTSPQSVESSLINFFPRCFPGRGVGAMSLLPAVAVCRARRRVAVGDSHTQAAPVTQQRRQSGGRWMSGPRTRAAAGAARPAGAGAPGQCAAGAGVGRLSGGGRCLGTCKQPAHLPAVPPCLPAALR